MSTARYFLVTAVQQDAWILGCPVEIVKGALLFDSLSRQTILQLKLRNVGSSTINQVSVAITSFDGAGKAISDYGKLQSFTFGDLHTNPRDLFGDRTAIPLGDSSVKAVKVVFSSAIYANGYEWHNDEKLEGQPYNLYPIHHMLVADLVEQYNREYTKHHIGSSSVGTEEVNAHDLYPISTSDYWCCTCGFPNPIYVMDCRRCGTSKEWLFKTIDREFLLRAQSEYLELMQLKAQEEAAQTRKLKDQEEHSKNRQQALRSKLVVIACFLGVLAIAGVVIAKAIILPQRQYDNAIALQADGKQREAAVAFLALGHYKDSFDHYLAYSANSISAGLSHSVGLHNNGTVIATGDNSAGQCNIQSWTDVVSISAGALHTVGLRRDGTVLAVGSNEAGKWDV